jgi:hypothetical protein
MKAYFAQNQFCLVGKAWEVRHSLRKMLANQRSAHQPLAAALEGRFLPPAIHKPLRKKSLHHF